MNKHLTYGTHTFDKFHIIEHMPPNAGFFNIVSSTLNGIRHSLDNNWLPIVNYGKDAAPHFYDPAYGENVWAYYFEPVLGIGPDQLDALVENGQIMPEYIHRYESRESVQIMEDYIYDPDFIYTYWFFLNPEDPAKWMAEKRQLGRDYVARFLKVKPHILAKVEEFYIDNIRDYYTVGAHIRGTDFAYAEPTGPQIYFDEIHRLLADNKRDEFKIFLATDQEQYVELFRKEFGDRVITYDSIRSGSDVPAFRFRDVSSYKKGEDVLIDAMLLSKCDYLLKCAASVGEYGMWFNPTLECTDFSFKSRFKADGSIPAYHVLNIGQLSPTQLRLVTSYRKARLALLETVTSIGRAFIPAPIRDRMWKAIGRHIFFPESDADKMD